MNISHKKKTFLLLSISQKFSPETNPTAIRSSKTLKYLPDSWQIHVLSENENAALERAQMHFARSWYPQTLIRLLKKIKLTKVLEWLIWPDDSIFWLISAVLKGRKIIRGHDIDVIIVFLKPYSSGLVGVLLKWMTRKPLVINICEPSTCDDLYAVFPSKLHYHLDRWLEDFYVRQADRIIYVSQLSLELVRSRQSPEQFSKFRLLRGGADPQDFEAIGHRASSKDSFEIVYTGGMTGWNEFLDSPEPSIFAKLRQAWMKLGQYHNMKVDASSSSPVFIGQAIQQILDISPHWAGRIKLKIYGNKFLDYRLVLEKFKLLEFVEVEGPIPHSEVLQKLQSADLLFMALPDRIDNTPGDRISLKTYEYLMTDRPILAAVPQGENRNYLTDKSEVHLVEPDDVKAMAGVITNLFSRKLSGESLAADRTREQAQVSYAQRGQELSNLLTELIDNRSSNVLIQTIKETPYVAVGDYSQKEQFSLD